MKVIYAQPGQTLICKKCKTPIVDKSEMSDDGGVEDYWCDPCTDFVDVLAVWDSPGVCVSEPCLGPPLCKIHKGLPE